MNENNNTPLGGGSKRDIDSILNENANSIFEGTRSVSKSSAGNDASTVDKAKQEINAQADSMLREIEERRTRRAARQRELEQQAQAEAEAKARRQARLKAQEEMESKIKEASARNSRDGSTLGARNTDSSDMLGNFTTAPSQRDRAPERTVKRDIQKPHNTHQISSGETQIMPKITEANTSAEERISHRTRPRSSVSASHTRAAHVRDAAESRSPRATHQSSAARNSVTYSRRSDNKPKEVNMMKEIRDWVIAIAIAVVVSLLIRNFVFTLVKVQGESMQPTLQNEDRLYVNRFFYTPKKGDVVIFRPESDPNRPYIKRVIATEGDTVYIDFTNGDVYVNGNVIDEPYIKDKTSRSGEYINGLIASGKYSKDNPIVVEKDKIFVMGDNRNNSKDSRMIGQIPKDELIGGAVFRFWPLGKFGSVSYDISYLIEDEDMNFTIAA